MTKDRTWEQAQAHNDMSKACIEAISDIVDLNERIMSLEMENQRLRIAEQQLLEANDIMTRQWDEIVKLRGELLMYTLYNKGEQ